MVYGRNYITVKRQKQSADENLLRIFDAFSFFNSHI